MADATTSLNVSTEVQSINIIVHEHSDESAVFVVTDASAPSIDPIPSPVVFGTANTANTIIDVDECSSDDSIGRGPNQRDQQEQQSDVDMIDTPKTIKNPHYKYLKVDADGKRRFCCNECDRSFPRWCKLKLHMKDVHNGIRDHECKECGKRFVTSYHLNAHARTHTGKKAKSFYHQ